jgi:Leucine-rich repeat (LRR) protein
MRNIDPSRAIWANEKVERDFHTKNYDTLSYRLKESTQNNYLYLDLSNLGLTTIPDFTKHKHYPRLKRIKFLFLSENNLTDCSDKLLQFISLEALDVSHNKIKHISNLPLSLKELVCNKCIVHTICNHDNLERLDCSENYISELNNYNNVVELICCDNNISNIPSYNNVTKIMCSNNPIRHICSQINLKDIDCSHTNLSGSIDGFPKLIGLICNFTDVTDITHLTSLESLEIIGCNMNIPYIASLKCLLFCTDNNIQISDTYIVKTHFSEKNNAYVIFDNA